MNDIPQPILASPSADFSDEAKQLAARMDQNASIEQLLMTIDYYQRNINIWQRWVEAFMCHTQTLLRRQVEVTKNPSVPS